MTILNLVACASCQWITTTEAWSDYLCNIGI